VGDPAKEILKLIDKEKVDLVVMASHGAKGNFRFGSVTEKVLKNSPVPVTVVPVGTGEVSRGPAVRGDSNAVLWRGSVGAACGRDQESGEPVPPFETDPVRAPTAA